MVYDKNGDGVVIPGEYTITITEGGINDPKALKIHASLSLAPKKNCSALLEQVNCLLVGVNLI